MGSAQREGDDKRLCCNPVEGDAGEGRRNSIFAGGVRFFGRFEERFNCISDVYSGLSRNASGTAFWAYKSRDIFNVCVKAFSLKMEGGFL